MQQKHRHLLPQEIDLLVDGDVGFGVAPLRAHLGECDECRDRVSALSAVAASLDALPHFTPRLDFGDRVMQGVQVIEPWHVALLETGRRLVPTSAPMRALATVGAGLVAVAISGSAAWIAFRLDLTSWTYSVVLDRAREGILVGAGEFLRATFADVPGAGFAPLALSTAALFVAALAAVTGFRRLAATARAKRS